MPNSLIALLAFSSLMAAQYGSGVPRAEPQQRADPKQRAKALKAPSVTLLPAVPGRGLRDIPSLTINYYDVSGKTYADIVRSIEKQRPRDPATKQLMAGGAVWSLGASMTQSTVDKTCTVTGAKAEFAATAELPRLVDEQRLAPDQLAAWRAYLSSIEVPAAAGLWYVLDRLPAFEKSFVGRDCATASAFGSAAIDRLKREQAAFQLQHATPAAAIK